MTYYRNEQEFTAFQSYQKGLRKTANSLGALLLTFFGAEMIASLIIAGALTVTGILGAVSSTDTLEMLLNGLLSSVLFFLIGSLHCLIKGKSFARLFPFEKTGGRMVVMLSVIGLAAALASNYAADLTTDVFALFGVGNKGGEMLSDDSAPAVLLYFLTVAVLPACAEEFAFRGIIMGTLRPYSDGLALLVSSAMFAMMHGNFVQIPFTFCCGLAFGFVVLKTNSLLPAIIIHFLNNALAVAADLLNSYQLLSAELINLIYGVIFVVTGLLALVFLKTIIREKPGMFAFDDSDAGIPFREKLKTAACSPTLITFTAVMALYAIAVLLT